MIAMLQAATLWLSATHASALSAGSLPGVKNIVVSDPHVGGFALERISILRLLLGDVDAAVGPLLAHLREMRGNQDFTHSELEFAALALALRGRAIDAARLLGRVRAAEHRTPFRRFEARQDAYDLLISLLKQQLSQGDLEKAGAAGALLAPDEALDEALAALAR